MRRLRLFCWMILLLSLLGGAFGLLIFPAVENRDSARESYEQAREAYDAAARRQREIEERVSALRTHVSSVELGARTEYRLIRPGERIEVIETAAAVSR